MDATSILDTGKIKDLESKSQILCKISDDFGQVRQELDITVLSCYETQKISNKIVNSLSARRLL
jgi:hypothetical protein